MGQRQSANADFVDHVVKIPLLEIWFQAKYMPTLMLRRNPFDLNSKGLRLSVDCFLATN